ncbi:MAG: Yip1 family protein [candidate division WOR-3 bacterium]
MIERIKGILFSPKVEWEKIKGEPTTIAQVLTGYAAPLALIPAIFGFLGYILIGVNFGMFGFVRYPLVSALVWAIVWFILTLVGLYIEGIVINALAPSFDSAPNPTNAFKLAVYSMTPYFVAGVLYIIPVLGVLVMLISLYGLYLMYLGMPVMMSTPKEKVIGYMIVAIIVMFVINIIIGAIAGGILAATYRPIWRF